MVPLGGARPWIRTSCHIWAAAHHLVALGYCGVGGGRAKGLSGSQVGPNAFMDEKGKVDVTEFPPESKTLDVDI